MMQYVLSLSRRKFKTLVVIITVIVVLVLIKQTSPWQKTIKNFSYCTEIVYTYKKKGIDLLSDVELRHSCTKLQSKYEQNKTRTDLLNKQYITNDKLVMFTKCGTLNPVLLSSTPSNSFEEISTNTKTTYKVPNIVHFVSIGTWKFSFLNYLSILSVHKYIKPWAIYIHGDKLPVGEWWDRAVKEISGIYHVHRDIPRIIQDKQVGWLEHSSDVLRLQTLYDNGGIYLDTDVLVLKSFNDLRNFDVVLGRETKYGLGSSIIISSPQSAFLCIWKETFRNYSPYLWNWATYAVWTPSKLAELIPDMIHIENNTLQQPSWTEAELLFNKVYNWSNSYAIHIWKRYGEVPNSPEEIKSLNTTLGYVMRYIYYGSSNLLTSAKYSKEESHLIWSFSVAVDVIGSKILTFLS